MGIRILLCITDVSILLSQITAYRDKEKIELECDLLSLLIAFNHQNYSQLFHSYLHVELTNFLL